MYNNNVILNVYLWIKQNIRKRIQRLFQCMMSNYQIPNSDIQYKHPKCIWKQHMHDFSLQKRTCWACVTRKIAAYVFRRTCVWMLEHVRLPSGHAHADGDGAAHVQAERVRVSLHAWGGSEEPAHKDDGRTGHREHQEPVPQKVTDPLWQTRSGRCYTHIYADAFNQKEEQKQQYSEYLD